MQSVVFFLSPCFSAGGFNFLRALIGQLCPAAPGLLGRVGGGVILYLNAFSSLFQ